MKHRKKQKNRNRRATVVEPQEKSKSLTTNDPHTNLVTFDKAVGRVVQAPAEDLLELTDTPHKSDDLDALLALRMTTVSSEDETDTNGTTEWLGFTFTQKRVFALADFPRPVRKVVGEPPYCLRQTSNMGMGVFARRDIKAGELIVAERPLVVVPADITDFANSLNQTGEQDKARVTLEIWEETYQMLIDRLSPEDRAAFLDLTNCHTQDGSGKIMGIIQTNGYAVDELDEDQSGPLDDGFSGYSAVGKIGSRFNHSCMSNVLRRFDLASFSLVFTTTRDVRAGEQMFMCYCTLELGAARRAAELAPYNILACKCLACVNATPERDGFREGFSRHIQELFRRSLEWERDPALVVSSHEFRTLLDYQRMAIEEGFDRTMFYAQLLTAIIVVYRKLGLNKKADDLFSSMKDMARLAGVY